MSCSTRSRSRFVTGAALGTFAAAGRCAGRASPHVGRAACGTEDEHAHEHDHEHDHDRIQRARPHAPEHADARRRSRQAPARSSETFAGWLR
jgi:hypothetical protein